MRPAPLLLPMALLGVPALAQAFEFRAAEPGFIVSVPALPAVLVTAQPSPTASAASRSAGSDGRLKVEIVATKSDKAAISTRECAGLGLRRLVARPGMPDRDSIYRAPLDAQTFLVIYRAAIDGPLPELHAHLLAAVHGSHCVEVHVTRLFQAGEDEDDWREAFRGARIDDGLP